MADWISENINPETPGDYSHARSLAKQCRVDAHTANISDQGLNAAVDDMIGGGDGLTEFISRAMRAATDEEMRRLGARDH